MRFRRVAWLVIILIALSLYFPINRTAHGGMQLQLPFDRNIPLFPPAIVPYLFGTALFVGFPIWSAIRAKPREFEAYAISILLATVISYFVYIVFPTFVARPEIVSSDIFSKAIEILYKNDKAYNAVPSGHAFYTTLSFLYLSRWKPNYRFIWLAIAALILASTLLTRQHNIIDLVSGLVLGVLAYIAGRLIQKKWDLIFGSQVVDDTR